MMRRILLAAALLAAAMGAQAAELTLFGRPGFEGPRFKANDSVANLDRTGFNDRASSVIIREGVWQLCDDAHYRGHCVTLQPGRYPSLREIGLDNRVSSAREAAGWVATQGRPYERGRDRGVGAVLYSNPDFRGDRYVVEGNYMRDLANTGFNDRAQSLRVERGYWIFCSDADFQGQCRTFGPGDYRRLPRALDNRISSGRRISERYPYGGQPNWER